MRIHRFYYPEFLADELHVTTSELVHQWKNVLRIKEGEHIRIFNGKGVEREYIISEFSKDHVVLVVADDIIAKLPAREVTVFFALLKKEKNEWVIQKCTEIGVTRFVPMITERTEKTGFVKERMEKIAIEASEQCGRADVPEIVEPLTLLDALDEFGSSMELVVCDMDGEVYEDGAQHTVGYFVGPEGGWTDKERELFAERGVKRITLGAFTFRAETAALAGAIYFSEPHEGTSTQKIA